VVRGDRPQDVSPDDWDVFSDAIFLSAHPGWTWQALQDAPDEVIEIIRKYESARQVGHGRHVQG
jgi:hypothetical protein